MTNRMFLMTALAVVLVGFVAAPASAQGAGIRAGVSGDPNQFYVGVHDEMGPVANRLWFRPNVEIGVGDDVTVVSGNLEFVYRSRARRRSEWGVYFGGGPALNIVRSRRDTDAGGGFNVLVGLQHRRGLFAEVKLGLADSPAVKFGVGYVFH